MYAPNSKRERRVFCAKMLDVIKSSNINKGIIMGDFNTPILDDEKSGGLAPDQDNKLDLSNFTNILAFMDVDLSGRRFTWSNRWTGGDCIQVFLD